MRRKWILVGICAVALAFAAGCSKTRDDAALATSVKAAMFSDARLKDANIDVSVKDGVATLEGSVASYVVRDEAEKVASAAGARTVEDRITIQVAESVAAAPPVGANGGAGGSEDAGLKPSATSAVGSTEKRERKVKEARLTKTVAASQVAEPPAPAPQTPLPVAQDNNAASPAPAAAPAAAPVTATAAPAPPAPPAPEPTDVQIPANTTVTVRMIDGVDSSVNHTGEIFHASLDTPIVVNNNVIVPRGADVYIRLTGASTAGTMKGKSELHLELVKMDFQGRSYSLVSGTYSLAGKSRGQDTAKKVGGGAVIGTIIGAIAGGGKGAAIGAAVGAAGGGIYQSATKGQLVKIPAETRLDFQLEQPVTITVQPRVENTNSAAASN
jgi:hypothetical protein